MSIMHIVIRISGYSGVYTNDKSVSVVEECNAGRSAFLYLLFSSVAAPRMLV
jgi:hypothetical protein